MSSDPDRPIAWDRDWPAQEHQDFLALADAAAADIHVPCRGAEERLHRASKRIASSNALRASDGSLRSRANSSGKRARQ